MNTEQLNEQLLATVQDALDDLKAVDITTLNVRSVSSFTDYMVIATGTSSRQVIALAKHVIEQAKAAGQRPIGDEGLDNGEWALIDLGDIIVHVMLPQTRDFYQLEKMWNDAAQEGEGDEVIRDKLKR